jgi:S-layer family protein
LLQMNTLTLGRLSLQWLGILFLFLEGLDVLVSNPFPKSWGLFALWIFAALFAAILQLLYRNYGRRWFWACGHDTASLIYGQWSVQRGGEFEPVVNLAVVSAVLDTVNSLSEALTVRIDSSRPSGIDRHANLILVGGPLANPLTTELCERMTCRFSNDVATPRAVVDNMTGAHIESKVDGNGNIIQDVGWFIRAPNPYSADHVVIIAAGNYGVGTQAVLRYLTSPAMIRRFRQHRRKSSFQGVVTTKLDGGVIHAVELTMLWAS